jgi:hypothetical protein
MSIHNSFAKKLVDLSNDPNNAGKLADFTAFYNAHVRGKEHLFYVGQVLQNVTRSALMSHKVGGVFWKTLVTTILAPKYDSAWGSVKYKKRNKRPI